MILVRRASNSGIDLAWDLVPRRTRVLSSVAGQLDDNGFPIGFKVSPVRGISDHLPLIIELAPR